MDEGEDRPVRRLLHDPARTADSPGVQFVAGVTSMANASADGVYTMTDEHGQVHRFKAVKGSPLPEGAVVEESADDAEPKPAAKTKKSATGPSETTDAAVTPETA